jgi:hypothetical protein
MSYQLSFSKRPAGIVLRPIALESATHAVLCMHAESADLRQPVLTAGPFRFAILLAGGKSIREELPLTIPNKE